MKIEYMDVGDFIPYKSNAKEHPAEQVKHIANSIREFGFKVPILVDDNNVVVAGHGRLLAAKLLGLEKAPYIRLSDLNPEQIKAFRLADNKVSESPWNSEILYLELASLDFELQQFGFETADLGGGFFSREDRNDTSRQEGNDEYNDFLEKFEQPKTTDDCYTPENIYDAVLQWCSNRYSIKSAPVVRPFFPGGDYKKHPYPDGSVVVDNPPFSILAEIIDFYIERGIRFFLFAPGLATLNYIPRGVTSICCYASVTYENGAVVCTSFVTNMEKEPIAAMTAPELSAAIEKADNENVAAMRKSLPKYEYPVEVATAAGLGYLSKYGQALIIPRDQCCFIRALDAQKEADKGIFGGGLLLSEKAAAEKAAAEKAAAEKAAAEKWQLSKREIQIIKHLGSETRGDPDGGIDT